MILIFDDDGGAHHINPRFIVELGLWESSTPMYHLSVRLAFREKAIHCVYKDQKNRDAILRKCIEAVDKLTLTIGG